MSKTIAVSKCSNCPFFEATPLQAVGKFIGVEFRGGFCRYIAREGGGEFVAEIRLGLPPGPERERELQKAKDRIQITHKDAVPEGCPLRTGDIVVSLGS